MSQFALLFLVCKFLDFFQGQGLGLWKGLRMARGIFFSFHYERDILQVHVFRNHYLTKGGYSVAGYWDRSLWEDAKRTGAVAVKRMIDNGLRDHGNRGFYRVYDGTASMRALRNSEESQKRKRIPLYQDSWHPGHGPLASRVARGPVAFGPLLSRDYPLELEKPCPYKRPHRATEAR